MKKIPFNRYVYFVGLLVWLIPTAYFGFQLTPTNGFEKATDFIGSTLMLGALLHYIFSGVSIHKNYEKEKEIHAKNLYVIDKGELDMNQVLFKKNKK